MCAIGEGEERELLSLHELFDQDLGSCRTECLLYKHHLDRGIRLLEGLRDHHPPSPAAIPMP